MKTSELLPAEVMRDGSDPVREFETMLEEAARAVDAEPWILQRLKHAEREITFNLPLVRDDGSVINVTAYRIQHSRASGPSIGPVELSPTAYPGSIRPIASEITLQSVLLGLRFGGAAGAIVVHPEQLTERELRTVMKAFASSLHENSGPLRDVVVCEWSDVAAQWMEEANTQARGRSEPASIIGKPDDTSLIPAWAATCSNLIEIASGGGSVRGKRVVMQGFGRQARALIRELRTRGARIVAVADRAGGLLCEDGLDVTALESHVERNGVLFGFPDAEAAANSDLLVHDCDVLILAAAPRQIGTHNAEDIRASVVFEVAQHAIEADGETMLPKLSRVVPHLVVGTAQLATWAHAWRCGLSYSAPDPREAEADATARVRHAYEEALRAANEEGLSLRDAAVRLAVSRLARSLRMH